MREAAAPEVAAWAATIRDAMEGVVPSGGKSGFQALRCLLARLDTITDAKVEAAAAALFDDFESAPARWDQEAEAVRGSYKGIARRVLEAARRTPNPELRPQPMADQFWTYRVLESDDDGDPLDTGIIQAMDLTEALGFVTAHLRRVYGDLVTTVRFYDVRPARGVWDGDDYTDHRVDTRRPKTTPK